MIQPIGKKNRNQEQTIGFLETDFEKLAQEVNKTNQKYNAPKIQRLNISKQTTSSLSDHNQQHYISFLEGNTVPEPEKKVVSEVTPNSPNRLDSSFQPENRLSSSRSVARLSSTGNDSGSITDFGGPSRQMKSHSAPSIWDTDKLQKAAQEIDSKTASKMIKQQEVEQRRSLREEGNSRLVEALKSVDTRKASNIASASDQTVDSDQNRYSKATRNISIFDTLQGADDFARLSDKTAGERLSAEKKARAEVVDDSWRNGGRVSTSRGAMEKLFDILTQQSQKKE